MATATVAIVTAPEYVVGTQLVEFLAEKGWEVGFNYHLDEDPEGRCVVHCFGYEVAVVAISYWY